MNSSDPLPDDALLNIIRNTSTLPNRDDWLSFIAPEDALALLQLDVPLSDVARGHFTALLTNHEDSLAEIFDTGTLHARNGLSTVSIPERVAMQDPLYSKILARLFQNLDRSDFLRTLDLDFLALSDDVIEQANRLCLFLSTIGMRHFSHTDPLAARMIANKTGLRELFLSECDVSLMLSETIAQVHGRSLELLSFTRVKFMQGACQDDFWKSVGTGLRELVYVCNHFEGAEARWRSIAKNCLRLEVLRFEAFDTEVDWFRAFSEMQQTSYDWTPRRFPLDSRGEMWYRTLDNNLFTPTVADEEEWFTELTVYGQPIARHWMGRVLRHEDKLVFIPDSSTHAISRDIPQDVPNDALVEYINGLPPGNGFPGNLEPHNPDGFLRLNAQPYLVHHLSSPGAESDELHKRETASFQQALESIGPGLKNIYLYKWYGTPETTTEVVVRCPGAQVHVDLSNAKADDVFKLTDAVGPQLTELKLPRDPSGSAIDHSRVSRSCQNLKRLCVWMGPDERGRTLLKGALEPTGRFVTHLQFRSTGLREHLAAAEQALQIMAGNLSRLQKLLFDCKIIGPESFRRLASENRELREVCIRVYHSFRLEPRVGPSKESRIAGWICTFASLPKMKSITVEQRDPVLDSISYVCLEHVRKKVRKQCPDLKRNRELHIQVFSQALFR